MVSVASGAETAVRPGSLWTRWRALMLRHEWIRGYMLLSPTVIVMLTMLILPLIGLVLMSFWTQEYFEIHREFTFANYLRVLDVFGESNQIYALLLLKSIRMSLTATIAVVVMAYPMAYFLAFRVTKNKLMWIILITVPFWTSYLLRVFAWKVILGYTGVINSGLISAGMITEPLGFLLYNPTAVTITLAHAWAAYAILPIYVSLEKIDRSLLEAATDLGDTPFQRFWRVTFPLSLPGLIAATLLVFIPTVGDYVTPQLVGGTSGIMIGTIIASLFGKANNQPLGSAVSIMSMFVIAGVVIFFLYSVRAIFGKHAIQRPEG